MLICIHICVAYLRYVSIYMSTHPPAHTGHTPTNTQHSMYSVSVCIAYIMYIDTRPQTHFTCWVFVGFCPLCVGGCVDMSNVNEALTCTGWRRLIGSPKLQIIFHKRATKYRALLRKMTYKDKGSYESSPPCNVCQEVRRYICVTYRKEWVDK